MTPRPSMSHLERRLRRGAIEEALAAGEQPGVIAARHGVTYSTVMNVARHTGQPYRGARLPSGTMLRVLWLALQGTPQPEIVKQCGCSRQNVHAIVGRARDAGFVFPGVEATS